MQSYILIAALIAAFIGGTGCTSTTAVSRNRDSAIVSALGDYETQARSTVNRVNQHHQQLVAAQLGQLQILSEDQFNLQLEQSARDLAEQMIADSSKGMILPGAFGKACYAALLNDYNSLDSIITNTANVTAAYASKSKIIDDNFNKFEDLKTSWQNLAIKKSDRQELSAFISKVYNAYQKAEAQKKAAAKISKP